MFMSMSEHEGFGIPIIESMVFDLPVIAYAAAAVPETLDKAGVLFHEKQYDVIAEMMGHLVHNSEFRSAVLARQKHRLEAYSGRDLESELRMHLSPLLASV